MAAAYNTAARIARSVMENSVSRFPVLLLACAFVLASCSREVQAPAAAASAPTANAAAPEPHGGKVIQAQQAGAYTYAEVEWSPGQRVWIAGTQIDVKPGDEVQWGQFAVMRNFDAKSLGRTFEQILFVSSWGRPGVAPAATPVHGSLPMPAAPGAADANGSGVVKSMANAGGYSYIEVDRGGSTIWVAAMETAMKPGDRIQWQGGSEMRNFNAKSLGRTFDRVIFASAVTVTR